jgi:hypothetical protein
LVAESLDIAPSRPRVSEPQSVDDLDVNLEWLAYYQSRANTAKAVCEAKIRLAKSEEKKRLCVEVDGRDVNLADAVAEIKSASIQFAYEHRDSLFADGSKTRALNHGAISFCKRPEGISLREGISESDAMAKVEARAGILGKIKKWLEDTLFDCSLDTFLRIKLELNKSGILSAWKSGKLSARDLRTLGFEACGGDEICKIEPAEYTLQSLSKTA